MRSVFVAIGVFVLLTGVLATAQEEPPSKLPVGAVTPRPEGPEWADLLDAERAPGWVGTSLGAQTFEIVNGVLHIFGTHTGTYAGYKAERVRDFALHLEFKVAPLVNSGVILRGELETPALTGLEIQILDDAGRPPAKTGCGALYDVASPMFNMSFPAGQWNSYDITLKARILTVYLNGWKVLDVDLGRMTMPLGRNPVPLAQMALDGYICLQDFGGECWFRNIMLKQL